MSIIQSLREKGAWIMTAVIAFALFVFVIEEGIRNKNMFGGGANTLGEINGKEVKYQEFEQKLQDLEKRYVEAGYTVNDQMRNQQRESLWNQYVEDAILDKEIDKLGFEVTEAELNDYLYGANPPADFKQRFTDPKTGLFDGNAAASFVAQLKRQKSSAQAKAVFEEYFPALMKQRKKEKLETIIQQSLYVPKWVIEKTSAENSQIASFSFVNVPYVTIPDSTIQVSDEDVRAYINKNKDLFKQEKARGFDFVSFSASPSQADSLAVQQSLVNLKDSFAAATNIEQYLQNEGSVAPYYNGYIARKEIQIPNIDTIIKTPVGSVYGPYVEGSNFTIAKVVGARQVPEMVKARHILISTHQQNPQTGQLVQVRLETDAKRLIDSIETAVKGGANFDTLCLKYSEDGTRDKGGVYDSVKTAVMDAAFNDFLFTNPVGTKGVVQTVYGYHYVEVMAHKGPMVPAYKIGYLTRNITASEETENAARSRASQFAAASRDKASFEANAKKENVPVQNAAEVAPLAAFIPGMDGNTRELVRWLYNDAKVGSIPENPFLVGDSYIVPVVTHIYEEGLMDVARARANSEFRIRQEKKAAQIAQKIGNPTSLEDVSKVTNQPILRADSAAFNNPTIPGGNEPRVVGAAFNKANANKISPVIAGEVGAYVIKTERVFAVPSGMDVKAQQAALQNQFRMFAAQRNFVENFKKEAKIKDNRYKFF